MSDTDANKATFRRVHDALNSGDTELIAATIDAVFAPDVRIGTPVPVQATGAEAYKQLWAMLLRAFPDLHVTVEDVIAEGDKLVARNTVTGTNLGEYQGRPPTGRSVSYGEIFILRSAAGRVVETWGLADLLSQRAQLGLVAH
ncbi:MAG: ester cyclase [Catenulispora sp.]